MVNKVCFPQFANYAGAFRYIFEKGFDVEYLKPPVMTKRTLELGSMHSPDYVCAPFKICLGSYIEALNEGATCLMQIYGACRLNYYGELSEQILRDLGYEFQMFNMVEINWHSLRSIMDNFRIVNPDVSPVKVASAVPTALDIIKTVDVFDDYVRHNVGFEVNRGEFESVYGEFLDKLYTTDSKKEFDELKKLYRKKLFHIPINKPSKTLKVGMVGDYFTVQEPFGNYFMERELGKMGMEIYRKMNFSSTIIHSDLKERKKSSKNYTKFFLGATSNYTVGEAVDYAKEGVDGIIQVKSFGCTPEIDAMPILQNISRDYKIPVLHFSFDSQTSETGVKTRLEAFYDMVEAKKKG